MVNKFCNCNKNLFTFIDQTHNHLKVKDTFGDLVLIDGSLDSELHCNICNKPLINMGTYYKRDNDG